MPTSQKQLESAKKYHAKFDKVEFRVPKGKKDEYQEQAQRAGMSLTQYIVHLLEKAKQEEEDQ